MGIDVHENPYKNFKLPFEAGMIFTVEPAFISMQNKIRMLIRVGIISRYASEDDILVTPTGYEVLSGHLPKDPKEIEAAMAGKVPEAMAKIGYKKLNLFSGQDETAHKNVLLLKPTYFYLSNL